MGIGVVDVGSVKAFLAVGVPVTVPVVAVTVVVNGFVIPRHAVDVKHRQDPHGSHAHQQHDPGGESLSLLTKGKFCHGHGFSVKTAPEAREFLLPTHALPPAK